MRFQGFWLALICVFACSLNVDVRAQEAEDSATSEAEIIQFIRVEGTQRVEEETVRAYMVVREGMVDDVDMVDQSVKTLPC